MESVIRRRSAACDLNIPLLPIQIDVCFHFGVRWRSLRTFRFTIRVLMLIVGITAIFCSLWVWFQAYQGRLARANNYHGEQAFDPFLPGVVNRPWHAKMYHGYHAALLRNGMIVNTLESLDLRQIEGGRSGSVVGCGFKDVDRGNKP